METLVIKPRTKSDARFLHNFSRNTQTHDKPKTEKDLSEEDFISLIVEEMNSEKVDRKEVMSALYNSKNKEDLAELYEDLCLGRLMEEAMNDPENAESVSFEEIMEALRQ